MELNKFQGKSQAEILESLEPSTLKELRAVLLGKISDYERQVHLINDILEGEDEYSMQ